jgi:hypothetical protein
LEKNEKERQGERRREFGRKGSEEEGEGGGKGVKLTSWVDADLVRPDGPRYKTDDRGDAVKNKIHGSVIFVGNQIWSGATIYICFYFKRNLFAWEKVRKKFGVRL